MNISKTFLCLASILILLSCKKEVNNNNEELESSESFTLHSLSTKKPLKEISSDFELEEQVSSASLEKNLFGKFFDGRAEFFVIENPQKTILNAKVTRLTLFYLDGKLAKLKYELESNISNELLNIFGGCKITGLDYESRYEMTHSDVILKENNKYILSDKLKNYLIQWDLDDKKLVMLVKNDDEKTSYVYEEKVKNYEKSFKSIEYNKAPPL